MKESQVHLAKEKKPDPKGHMIPSIEHPGKGKTKEGKCISDLRRLRKGNVRPGLWAGSRLHLEIIWEVAGV